MKEMDKAEALGYLAVGIVGMEEIGQKRMVSGDILPKDGLTDEKCQKHGITILGEHDDLFYTVKLPDGWRKVATDHQMWSDLLNADGEQVAGIFYKAAFYDRSAFISWNE